MARDEQEEEREFLADLEARTGRDLAAWMAAITALDNAPSQRVLEKIGFRHLGTRSLPGHDDDSAYFETA